MSLKLGLKVFLLLHVDIETNTTAISHQSKYNEQGYVFTAAVGRSYWVHWDIPYRLDPARLVAEIMDMRTPF